MAFTAHGHHIPGTIRGVLGPSNVARCGGVEICPKCKQEVEEYKESTTIQVPLVLHQGVKVEAEENLRKVQFMVRRYMDNLLLSKAKSHDDLPPEYRIIITSYNFVGSNWRATAVTDTVLVYQFDISYDFMSNRFTMTVYKTIDIVTHSG